MLTCAGLGALRLECAEADEADEEWNDFDRAEIEEALDLVRRSEVLWMAALAVLILAGLLI
jgi:cobalamin biosynthesis protein CobD/CbiB